jgi:hypothetical protein
VLSLTRYDYETITYSNQPPVHGGKESLDVPGLFYSPQHNRDAETVPDTGIGRPNPDAWRKIRNQTKRNERAKRARAARRRQKAQLRATRQYEQSRAKLRNLGKIPGHKQEKAYWDRRMSFNKNMLEFYKHHPTKAVKYYKPEHTFEPYPFRPLLHVRTHGQVSCRGTDAVWTGSPAFLQCQNGQPVFQTDDMDTMVQRTSILYAYEEVDSIASLPDYIDNTLIICGNVYYQTRMDGGYKHVVRWKLQAVTVYTVTGPNHTAKSITYTNFDTSFHTGKSSPKDVLILAKAVVLDSTNILYETSGGTRVPTRLPEPNDFDVNYWRDNLLARMRYNERELYRYSGGDVQLRAPVALADAISNVLNDATAKIPVMSQNNLKTLKLFGDFVKLLIQAKNGDLRALDDAVAHASRIIGKPKKRIYSMFFDEKKLWRAWQQAHFTGRYVWATNVMNYNHFYDYMVSNALPSFRDMFKKIHATHTFDEDAKIYVGFSYKDKALKGLLNAYQKSYYAGILPTSYVLWDMLPFSFIADWFVPIQNALQAHDRSEHLNPTFLEFKDGFEYSIKYQIQFRGASADVYFRFKQGCYPTFDLGSYMCNWKQKSATDMTIGLRVADGIFLATSCL